MILRSQCCSTTFVIYNHALLHPVKRLSKIFPNISKQVAKEKEEAGKMLEERKSRKVGQTFSTLANEASTEIHNVKYSMQPNLSIINKNAHTAFNCLIKCKKWKCKVVTITFLPTFFTLRQYTLNYIRYRYITRQLCVSTS